MGSTIKIIISSLAMSIRRSLVLSAVVGLTLAIALSADVTSLDSVSDLEIISAPKNTKPSATLKGKWAPIDGRTHAWKAEMDICGNNNTCADLAGAKAMRTERQLLDAGAIPACAEKNDKMMEEISVVKREVKAGEDKIAKFKKATEKSKESDSVKAAAKEPAASAQANAKGKKQGKKPAELMLGESKDEATAVSAETAVLVPNRTLVLQAINKTNAGSGNATSVQYESIFACNRKSMELMIELKASKVARADTDTKQMRIANDVQLTTGGGGKLPKTPTR